MTTDNPPKMFLGEHYVKEFSLPLTKALQEGGFIRPTLDFNAAEPPFVRLSAVTTDGSTKVKIEVPLHHLDELHTPDFAKQVLEQLTLHLKLANYT